MSRAAWLELFAPPSWATVLWVILFTAVGIACLWFAIRLLRKPLNASRVVGAGLMLMAGGVAFACLTPMADNRWDRVQCIDDNWARADRLAAQQAAVELDAPRDTLRRTVVLRYPNGRPGLLHFEGGGRAVAINVNRYCDIKSAPIDGRRGERYFVCGSFGCEWL